MPVAHAQVLSLGSSGTKQDTVEQGKDSLKQQKFKFSREKLLHCPKGTPSSGWKNTGQGEGNCKEI